MALKNIGSLYVELIGTVNKFQKQMSKAQSDVERFARRVKTIGTRISAISLPLAGIAGAALKIGADFEAAMNKVSALGEIVGDDLKKLEKQAIDLGKSTKFSAQEAAEGMGEFAAAGFDANKIAAVMPGTLDLAAAGQLSVARAAEITATTLGQFSMEATEAGKVADVLASSAARGSTSVEDIAQAMKYAGTVADVSGQNFVELSAALTLLSNKGIKAGDAGTDLAAGFANLLKPTKQMLGALDELGVKLSDLQTADGKIKPLNEVLRVLNEHGIKGRQIFALFGKENAKSWASLLGQGAPALQEMTRLIDQDTEAAKRMAETLRKGLKGSFEEMKGSIETAAIVLSQILAPAAMGAMATVQGLFNALTDLGQVFQTLPSWIQTSVVGFAGFLAVLGPLVIAVGLLSKSFVGLISIVRLGATVMTGVLAAGITPFGALTVAAGALAVAAVEVYRNWEPIKQFFSDFAKVANAWIDQFVQEFRAGLEAYGQMFVQMKDIAVDAAAKLYEGVKTYLLDKLTAVFDTVKEKVKAVRESFEWLYDKVVGNSDVPDMVDAIGMHIDRLQGEMVDPTVNMCVATGDAFEDLSSRGTKAASSLTASLSQVGQIAGQIGSKIGEALGLGSRSGVLGGFLESIVSGSVQRGPGGAIASVLGNIFGGEKGLGGIASSIGEFFGMKFGDSATDAISQEVRSNLDGSIGSEIIPSSAIDNGTTNFMAYADAIMSSIDAIEALGKSTEKSIAGITELAGTVGGAIFGGPVGAQIGNFLGSEVGGFLGDAFGGGPTNPDTLARKKVEDWFNEQLKDKLFKIQNERGQMMPFDGINFGDSGRFGQPGWADEFNKKQNSGVFASLGEGIRQVLGIVENVGPQIGAILHEQLFGNLENANIIAGQLGLSLQDMQGALLKTAEAGNMSWHDYNVHMANLNQAFSDGEANAQGLKSAVDAVVNSAGTGAGALDKFRAVAATAMKQGAKDIEDAKRMALQSGADPEVVEAIFQSAAQRGIKALDEWREASNALAGAAVGDMYAISESLAARWDQMSKGITEIQEQINQIPDKVEKSIVFNVGVNADDAAKAALSQTAGPIQAFGDGAVVMKRTNFFANGGLNVMAERGPEGILPLKKVGGKLGVAADGVKGKGLTIVVNAPNAAPGEAQRIMQVVRQMEGRITGKVIENIIDNSRRGGRYSDSL